MKQKKEARPSPPDPRDVGLLFLANFVHQLVNPLNGVAGTLSNITDGTYTGQTLYQKINASRGQLEQCITLIRNLAYLSDFFFETPRDDALKPAKEMVISILPQVVIEAIQFFQISADQKGMKLELVDSRTQYKVRARPELLKQVFINLFDNWLKYGLPDQTVRVESMQNDKDELIVEIVGKSIGFDNTEADNLFQLGYRSTTAKNKVAQGSGIGLYICRQIIEKALSGKITAHHSNARGESHFRIAIPKQQWHI